MLYNLLIILVLPFAMLRLLWKSRRQTAYRARWNERFAYRLPKALPNSLLVHTVSVGEFLAARPLLHHILHQHPELNLYLTCTTPTGSAQIQAFQAQYPDRVRHSYLPYDVLWLSKRFMRHVQPRLLLLMETEIWPNLIRAAAKQQVPILLENARLSRKSCRAYARFARTTLRTILPLLTINAQHRHDAKRFVFLGATPQRVHITPNLKYHFTPPTALPFTPPETPLLWLAASTHAPEEACVLKAHRLLQIQHPKALLYLAPRHPERRAELVQLIEAHGYRARLRSEHPNAMTLQSDEILLLDTLGELAAFYTHSQVAFIGGSLFPRGGHNPLEAVHQGNSVCFGTHTHNFSAICAELATKRFVRILPDAAPETLCHAVLELHADFANSQSAKDNYLQPYHDSLTRHYQILCQCADLSAKSL